MKKILSAVLVLGLLLSTFGNVSDVYASSSSKPSIKKIYYDGDGKVSVIFKQDVSYSDAAIKVTDSNDKKVTAKITSKDKREINFKVSKIKDNGKYYFKISGVKNKGERKYTSVSGSFKVDDYKDSTSTSSSLKIKGIEYSERNSEISVVFNGKVDYKNAKVKVTDSSGKKVSSEITDKGSSSLTFKIGKFKKGETYSFKITGIKSRNDKKYAEVSGKFTSKQDAEKVSIRKASYYSRDKELDIYFNVNVKYKNTKVTVKDSKGKTYSAEILETGKSNMTVRVKGLEKGKKYTVKVSGVRNRDGDKYETVSDTFKVK